MKRTVLFISAFLVNGCGDLSASITPLNQTVTLVASKAYSPDVHSDAFYKVSRSTTVTIPGAIDVVQGNAGTFNMTLYIGSVTCTFLGTDFGTKYTLDSCSSGHSAGQTVTIHEGDHVKAHVNQGDSTQGLTQIQIQLYL